MDEKEFKKLIVNKNRGWRGLAEATVKNSEGKEVISMIFSFSEAVWIDFTLRDKLVVQDKDYYYILHFTDPLHSIPVGHQRSVLVKHAMLQINEVVKYSKSEWTKAPHDDWTIIRNFIKNSNNHTQSDWNFIRIKSNTRNIKK